MIINLKQSEIELALRAYVVSQGISLHGKDLSISFTAGRRESGISAEISIDDVEIPGFTTSTACVDTPTAPVAATVVTLVQPVITEEPEVAAAEEATPNEAQEVPEPVTEAKPTVSLFG